MGFIGRPLSMFHTSRSIFPLKLLTSDFFYISEGQVGEVALWVEVVHDYFRIKKHSYLTG